MFFGFTLNYNRLILLAMPLLSDYAKVKKFEYFFKGISHDAKILEIGCSSGWLKNILFKNKYLDYTGLDIIPPADIVGDIRNWQKLGLKKKTFDVIVAFEVVEHVDCFRECWALLKNGGLLLLTSPVPHFDWVCKLLETLGLNQKRTSQHKCIYLSKISFFRLLKFKNVGLIAQWGIFIK